jgi:hypothetical protein
MNEAEADTLISDIFKAADIEAGSSEADELAGPLMRMLHMVAAAEDPEALEIEFSRLIYARTGDSAKAMDVFARSAGAL